MCLSKPATANACSAITSEPPVRTQRVAKKTVFLGDLRSVQHGARPGKYLLPGSFAHTLFQRSEFAQRDLLADFVTFDGWWGGETRFNALCRRERDVLHLAIVGGGPAGCGLLTNHALNGAYEGLLDDGVAVLEASPRLGGGSLAAYAGLRSNSHGCAFFDAVKALGIPVHDDTLDKAEEIPMTDMHAIQRSIGVWHEARLAAHHTSRALTGAKVVSIEEGADGHYRIRYARADGGDGIRVVTAVNVCLCTGGVPHVPRWLSARADPLKLEHATDYFGGDQPLAGPRVAIVGFSHTAFALGDLLARRHPGVRLTFVRRRRATAASSAAGGGATPLIYFPSTEAADARGYAYEAADVCLDTGRVHRFGGLRGDARAFALDRAPHDATTTLDPREYDHVIAACGFQLRAPAMQDRAGRALRPAATDAGTVVTSHGRLFPGHRIYAFGIGAGLPPSEETGGEPGCTRRADGIWVRPSSSLNCSSSLRSPHVFRLLLVETALSVHGWVDCSECD